MSQFVIGSLVVGALWAGFRRFSKAPVLEAPTFFVVVSNPGMQSCKRLVGELLDRARQPDKVRVVVVERPEVKSVKPGKVETISCLLPHTSVHNRLGLSRLREERYTLLITRDAVMCNRWDDLALSELEAASNRGGIHGIITSCLSHSPDPSFIGLCVEDQCVVPVSIPWCGSGDFMVKSPYWCADLSLSSSEVWKTVQHDALTDNSNGLYDITMTAKLFQKGFPLYCTVNGVAMHREHQRRESVPPFETVETAYEAGMFWEFEEERGINVSKQQLSRDSQCGVFHPPDRHELFVKYGEKSC